MNNPLLSGRIVTNIFDVPVTVHLKDVELTQNGKRWSQVMYLNYLLKFKVDVEKEQYLSHFSHDERTGKIQEHKLPLDDHHTYIMGLAKVFHQKAMIVLF